MGSLERNRAEEDDLASEVLALVVTAVHRLWVVSMNVNVRCNFNG